jgi:hypothetical protein
MNTTSIIGQAHERGSRATTKSGAWKYLLEHLGKPARRRNSTPYDWAQWTERRMIRRADGRATALGHPLKSDQWVWYCQAYEDDRRYNALATTTLARTGYGEIVARRDPGPRQPGQHPTPEVLAYGHAMELLKASPLDAYDGIGFEYDRKGRYSGASGYARHVELYDFALDGHAIVVCVRETEGSEWGVKTISKKYHLVKRHEAGGISTEPTTLQVARYAKQGIPFGSIVDAAEVKGRPKLPPPPPPPPPPPAMRYKAVAVRADGTLASIYDDSVTYAVGREMRQTARPDHGGGWYVYRSEFEAAHCHVPKDSDNFFLPRAIIRLACTGRAVYYDNGKMAFSAVTPVAVVHMPEINTEVAA